MNYDADAAKAIFYQQSKVTQEEFAIIQIMIERENIMKRLRDAIQDVNDLRRELDDAQILKTFRLFNALREVTMRFLFTIEKWQASFTHFVRPSLYNVDYLSSKFIRDAEFINASKVRKLFNFQFYRGNVLLLPFPSLALSEPLRVNADLGREIRLFAAPDEEKVIACYQILVNALPREVFTTRLVSLEKWLVESWTPSVFVSAQSERRFFGAAAQRESEKERDRDRERERASRKSSTATLSMSTSQRKASVLSTSSKREGEKGTEIDSREGKREREREPSLPVVVEREKEKEKEREIERDRETDASQWESSSLASESTSVRRKRERRGRARVVVATVAAPPSEIDFLEDELRRLNALFASSLCAASERDRERDRERPSSSQRRHSRSTTATAAVVTAALSEDEIHRGKRVFFAHRAKPVANESELSLSLSATTKEREREREGAAALLSSKRSRDRESGAARPTAAVVAVNGEKSDKGDGAQHLLADGEDQEKEEKEGEGEGNNAETAQNNVDGEDLVSVTRREGEREGEGESETSLSRGQRDSNDNKDEDRDDDTPSSVLPSLAETERETRNAHKTAARLKDSRRLSELTQHTRVTFNVESEISRKESLSHKSGKSSKSARTKVDKQKDREKDRERETLPAISPSRAADNAPYRKKSKSKKELSLSTVEMRAWFVEQQAREKARQESLVQPLRLS